jgi:ABC-type lipoprotein export system ATPase subunit
MAAFGCRTSAAVWLRPLGLIGGWRGLAKKAKKVAGAKKPTATEALLDNVSLSFLQGAKIGVLGANGAGKSTLLKVVGRIDTEIEGEVWVKPGLTIGYMHQEPQLDPTKDALGNVLDGVRERYDLVRRYDAIAEAMAAPDADLTALIDEQALTSDAIDDLGCWDIVRDVQSAMRNLRCPADDSDVSTLSGGERRRVALCRLLLSKPDILMLVRARDASEQHATRAARASRDSAAPAARCAPARRRRTSRPTTWTRRPSPGSRASSRATRAPCSR